MITKTGRAFVESCGHMEKDAWLADVLSARMLRGVGKFLRTSAKAQDVLPAPGPEAWNAQGMPYGNIRYAPRTLVFRPCMVPAGFRLIWTGI